MHHFNLVCKDFLKITSLVDDVICLLVREDWFIITWFV